MSDTWDSLDNQIFKQKDLGRVSGGRPVDSSTYAPSFDEEGVAPIAIDKNTGGVLVHQTDSSYLSDTITTFQGSLSKRIDEASATVIYIGEAAPGASEIASVWRIKKIDFTNPISVKWAGTGEYNQVWSNRASLTYT